MPNIGELDIGQHSVVGLLGTNGAGKTTLINTLVGVHEHASLQHMTWRSRATQPRDKAFQLGRYAVFTESSGFAYWSLDPYLRFTSRVFGRSPDPSRVDELVAGFGFELFRRKTIGNLSTGNKKKAFLIAGLLLTRGSAAMHGRAGSNYFLRASLADRVVWINAVGLFAVATVFTVTSWEQGLRFPLAWALIAVNSPLTTMISGDPDLARQLTMLGRPALAWWHYAVAVAFFLGTFNVGVGVVYWLLGARDLPLLAGLVIVVTALEALAVPALERHVPLRGLHTRRDAWRHPRKYLLPAALLLAFAWIRLG